jgi:hypothetical protein
MELDTQLLPSFVYGFILSVFLSSVTSGAVGPCYLFSQSIPVLGRVDFVYVASSSMREMQKSFSKQLLPPTCLHEPITCSDIPYRGPTTPIIV